jgi:hypothetical protein
VARSRAALSGFIVLAVLCGWAVVREWLSGAAAAFAAQAAVIATSITVVPAALADAARKNDRTTMHSGNGNGAPDAGANGHGVAS